MSFTQAMERVRVLLVYLICYGLYFGVLTRDIAEVCSHQISTALTLAKRSDNGESALHSADD